VSEKQKGLYQKFAVQKLTNPGKKLDCLVLEFDDPVSRIGILAFANAAADAGYDELALDIFRKLEDTAPEETEVGRLQETLARLAGIPLVEHFKRVKGLVELLLEKRMPIDLSAIEKFKETKDV